MNYATNPPNNQNCAESTDLNRPKFGQLLYSKYKNFYGEGSKGENDVVLYSVNMVFREEDNIYTKYMGSKNGEIFIIKNFHNNLISLFKNFNLDNKSLTYLLSIYLV